MPMQPTNEDDNQVGPPVPSKPEGQGRLVALIAAIGVVILAVVAWFVVQNWRPSEPITQTPSPSDSSSQLSPWGPAMRVQVPPGTTNLTVGPAAGTIVVIGWWSDELDGAMQAVDLSTWQPLWSMNAVYDGSVAMGRNLVFVSDDNFSLRAVDAKTGVVLAALNPDQDNLVYVTYEDNSVVVTRGYEGYNLCGRLVDDLTSCAWEANALEVGPTVFDYKWVNVDGGVLDLSGEPAPFGADAMQGSAIDDLSVTTVYESGVPTVFYAGSSGLGYLRFEVLPGQDPSDDPTYRMQSFDPATGKTGPMTTMSGLPYPNTWDMLWLYSIKTADDGSSQVFAYDWATGQLGWQQSFSWTVADVYRFSNSLIVTQDDWDAEGDANLVVLDPLTGQQRWSGQGFQVVGDDKRAAYLVKDGVLYAFDETSPGFEQLWTEQLPADDAQVFAVDEQIVAVSMSTGRIWVLT